MKSAFISPSLYCSADGETSEFEGVIVILFLFLIFYFWASSRGFVGRWFFRHAQ